MKIFDDNNFHCPPGSPSHPVLLHCLLILKGMSLLQYQCAQSSEKKKKTARDSLSNISYGSTF